MNSKDKETERLQHEILIYKRVDRAATALMPINRGELGSPEAMLWFCVLHPKLVDDETIDFLCELYKRGYKTNVMKPGKPIPNSRHDVLYLKDLNPEWWHADQLLRKELEELKCQKKEEEETTKES